MVDVSEIITYVKGTRIYFRFTRPPSGVQYIAENIFDGLVSQQYIGVHITCVIICKMSASSSISFYPGLKMFRLGPSTSSLKVITVCFFNSNNYSVIVILSVISLTESELNRMLRSTIIKSTEVKFICFSNSIELGRCPNQWIVKLAINERHKQHVKNSFIGLKKFEKKKKID
jgi:hypothetical protein